MALANERRLKESDVTWLYGPLHGETNPVPPPKVASTADRLGIDDTPGKKSILKHRTLTQMLTTPVRVETPPNDSEEAAQHHETTTLPTHPHDLMEARQLTEEPPAKEADKDESTGEAEPKKHPRDRHISFNNRVEQYIAIDNDAQAPSYDDEEDYFDELDDEETEGSSSGDETQVQSPRTESRQIVAKLAPARLKTTGSFPAPSPQVVDPRGEESETSEEEPEGDADYEADDAQYSLSADPTPVTQDLRWDDKDGDDDDNEGEEYNLSASSNYAQSVSTVDNHRPNSAQAPDTDASRQHSHSDSADTALPNSGNTVDRGRSTQRHGSAECNEGNRIPPYTYAEQDKTQTAGELNKSPSGAPAEHSTATVSEESVSQDNAEQQQKPSAVSDSEECKPEPREHEGGVVSGVYEAVNMVRDLLGTLMGSSSDHVTPSHG